ncbi:MAG: hypothetical protein KJO01_11520 [Gammaproteobacteria bacterium]|nr:hypothetical protein [Gammaproteobacteria bacterium]MBT8111316.1 hypothetical protein [Gammaproteobacteria bacterium]NND46075.1 hypothetical protein [Woeseiaceae bacterium]NNL46014.1 hypothetical protein [Woeseiaceae bacterium]
MSNERKNRDSDRLVADTYRVVAQERVPEHLNKRMLRMAAREGRTPYSRARAWMRPAAWAATVGLSLAIVLELTRLPPIEPDTVSIAVPAQELADKNDDVAGQTTSAADSADRVSMDTFAPKDMAVVSRAESRARAQSGPNQVPVAPQADVDGAPDESAAARGVRADEDVPASSVIAERDTGERPSNGRRSAESLMAAPVSAAAPSAVAEQKAPESGVACRAELRESAESWIGCIRQLRDSGREELADREYEEFQRIFPNFAETEAHK